MELGRAWRWLRSVGAGREAAEARARSAHASDLIGSLKEAHTELLRQYTDIERMALEGRFAGIPAALGAFKARFDAHILSEKLHLYCYLEEHVAAAPDGLKPLQGVRGELSAIARGVVEFIRKYRLSGVRPANGPAFLAELRDVGAQLLRRVRIAESALYPLYRT